MLGTMESMVVLVAVLSLAVARATYLLRARTRELEAVRQATGTPPAGSAVGVVGRQRTELEEARLALADEQADREILLDLLDQGVLEVDDSGRIERADP
jgi:PAS domain-containing protein